MKHLFRDQKNNNKINLKVGNKETIKRTENEQETRKKQDKKIQMLGYQKIEYVIS